jgi:hypothetical protein
MYEGVKDTFFDKPYERVMDNRYGKFDAKLYGMKDNQAYYRRVSR